MTVRDRSEFTLHNQNDFNRVYRRGSSKGGKYAVILYRKNNLGYTRTAFVASKKVGNSVERNRSRRVMRESYRALSDSIRRGYDIIFVARNTINGVKQPEVEKSMICSLKACDLLV